MKAAYENHRKTAFGKNNAVLITSGSTNENSRSCCKLPFWCFLAAENPSCKMKYWRVTKRFTSSLQICNLCWKTLLKVHWPISNENSEKCILFLLCSLQVRVISWWRNYAGFDWVYIHFNKSTHHHFPGYCDRGNGSNNVQASFFSRFIFSTALSGVHYYENCFHIHF